MSDEHLRRAQQYQAKGYDLSHAFGLASFDARVAHWPEKCGDDFEAILFGDFDPPDEQLVFDQLGITIDPKVIEKAALGMARTALKARVMVKEKSVAAVQDAAGRLNLLVGILSYVNNGAPIRWWSSITKTIGGSLLYKLGDQKHEDTVALVLRFPHELRHRVTAALYWMREPRNMLFEDRRSDQFAVYAGYWNAFECLVEAANILVPRTKPTSVEKKQTISARLRESGESVGPGDIEALYREVVDPGLRAKAKHALELCTGPGADNFFAQCFDYKPSDRGLYSIRNSIQHGSVDIDDPKSIIMVAGRFPNLWKLVFSMMTGVLQLGLRKYPPHIEGGSRKLVDDGQE